MHPVIIVIVVVWQYRSRITTVWGEVKKTEVLVEKFELNPYRRPIWDWLKLYLTAKRYHLKRNKLNYHLLLGKEVCASRPDSSKQRK